MNKKTTITAQDLNKYYPQFVNIQPQPTIEQATLLYKEDLETAQSANDTNSIVKINAMIQKEVDNPLLGSVDYDEMIPILIKAIDELRQENTALKTALCEEHPTNKICLTQVEP